MVSRLVCDLPGHTPLKIGFLITWFMCMKSWLGGEQTGLWLTWSHTFEDRFSHYVAHVHEIMVGWWAEWFVTYLVTHLWRQVFSSRGSCAWNHGWVVSRLVCDLPGHTPMKTGFLFTWLMCMKSWLDGEQTGLWLTWSHTSEDRFSHHVVHAWNYGWMVSRLVYDLPGHTPLKTGFLITWLMHEIMVVWWADWFLTYLVAYGIRQVFSSCGSCMKSWLCGEQTGFWLTWSHMVKDRFSHHVAHVHEIMVGWWADWFVTYLVTQLWRYRLQWQKYCWLYLSTSAQHYHTYPKNLDNWKIAVIILKSEHCDFIIYTCRIIWAPSSEFVSSSIPSWQILTAHAQPFRGTRDLAFCLKVPLDSLLVWVSSEGCGETWRMRRLAWTFTARIGDKHQIRFTRSIFVAPALAWAT